MEFTSKQRSYLKGLASTEDAIFQIGKSSVTPQMVQAVSDALEKRELIKISVLKNCMDDPRELAELMAERTRSNVVIVIGKKIVLYRPNKKHPKIVLPK
ncbi:ribosome assembly RNA-binding protein YhbY [Lachnospiraceae bacterium 47-T17]